MSQTRTFGQYIAAARKACGLSLVALGDRVGLSAPYLHDVEHDRRRVAVERWQSFADALGVTVRSLAEAAASTGKIEIDASKLTAEQRAGVVRALVAAAKEGGAP